MSREEEASARSELTERKAAEEERVRLAMVVAESAEAVVITDADGDIVYVNPAFERLSGYARAELVGQNPRLLKSGRQDAAFYEGLWSTIASGEIWHGHFVNRRKDGTHYEEEATISAVRDAGGAILNYFKVGRDVTRERRLEEQLQQSQKLEAIGRLAGGVAHDFNNLLGVITGYGDLVLRDMPEADPNRTRIEEIHKAADRAAALTRQLLAFSRRQVLSPKALDLGALVTDMEKMLRRLLGEDIELVRLPAPRLGAIKADPSQIEQVIMNLVVNARDAMPDGGRLTIETEDVDLDGEYLTRHPVAVPGRYVMLAVSDTGCGIPEHARAHIFEPFFTTKAQGEGTGLGLATVYGIVKQSGGYVWAYSEAGRGTTFKVYLPRVDEAVGKDERDAPLALARGSETVLLVEDEGALRELIAEILESSGYTVLVAETAEDAARRAADHPGPIHMLVTDVIMPGLSGKQVADGVAALRAGIAVLYISGYTDSAIQRHGVLDPGVAFLAKPFTVDALLREVREVLEARRPGPAAS